MENLEKVKKSASSSKRRHTKPCSYYQTGTCRFSDEECDFLHITSDISTTQPHFKGKPCRYHLAGFCRNGDSCRFKHTSDAREDSLTSIDDTDITSPSFDSDDKPPPLEGHTSIDSGGEWSAQIHHHQYPLSPTSFPSGMLLSPVSPTGIYPPSAMPFPNSKDGTSGYAQSPLWSPSPYVNANEYPYDPSHAHPIPPPHLPLPSALATPGPLSPFHYPEDGSMYFYPYHHHHHSLYANAYSYPPSGSSFNALSSPAGSFDSTPTTSSSETSAIESSSDQWITPPSTGNSISSSGSLEAREFDEDYQPHLKNAGRVKSDGARPEPKLIIPSTATDATIDGLIPPVSSPSSEVDVAPSMSPNTSTTSSGASSTPKCLSPETGSSSRSRSKLKKDINREAKYKTKPCKFWKAKGACPRGDECTFMHGDGDKPRSDNHSQSQSSPVSSVSSDGSSIKHQLPCKPLSELEEKHKRGFFPINWRVIGGGVLMGKPDKKSKAKDKGKDQGSKAKPADLSLSPVKFPTLTSVEEIGVESGSSADSSEVELTFHSIWDHPKSATFDSRAGEEFLEGSSQRVRATSIPSTPRAAVFLGGALFAAAESPGNL